MRRFRFTLETVLRIRKRKEDDVKRELGAMNTEIAGTRRRIQEITGRLNDLTNEERERRGIAPSIVELRYGVAYRHKLKGDLAGEGKRLESLRLQAALIRKRLVEATKARRAVEIVKERRLREWKKQYAKAELSRTDDISQRKRGGLSRSAPQTVDVG
jgi:flagellar FliJ protein